MLHPSYSDLMKVVNADVEPGETKVVNSRYSIVMATAKRARQLVDGEEPLVAASGKKPLSIAVDELSEGKIKIIAEDELEEFEAEIKEQAAEKAKEIMAEREAAMAMAGDAEEEAEEAVEEEEEDADEEAIE